MAKTTLKDYVKRATAGAGNTLLTLYGDTVTIAGVDYQAAVNLDRVIINDAREGQITKRAASVLLPKAPLRDEPKVKDRVIHLGIHYRISVVDGRGTPDAAWLLTCVESVS
jgi:hypothetical protein